MSDADRTRIIGLAPNRTIVGGDPGRTMQMEGGFDPLRTQMGAVTTCAICGTQSPALESYCIECGFFLADTPAEEIAELPSEAAPGELVEQESGRRHRLKWGVNTVGRQGTDVVTSDATVSRVHARITLGEQGVLVEDLGSTNGTKVGDARISPNQPTIAASGTPVRFGNWMVTIQSQGAPGEAGGVAAQPTLVTSAASGESAEDAAPGAEAQDAIAKLVRIEGPSGDIAISGGTLTIGRKSGNDVVLDNDAYLSGQHAEVTADNNGVYLADLGSTNGTSLNGKKLSPNEPALLLEGDEVQLGQTKYRYELVIPREPEAEAADAGENAASAAAGEPRAAVGEGPVEEPAEEGAPGDSNEAAISEELR